LDSANNSEKKSVGELSPLQLFGIIVCVAFVVIVVVIVIYKKFFHEQKINQDTFANLQVPLN